MLQNSDHLINRDSYHIYTLTMPPTKNIIRKSWVYGLIYFDPDDDYIKVCKPCLDVFGRRKVLKCGSSKNPNTTNLIRHMKLEHPLLAEHTKLEYDAEQEKKREKKRSVGLHQQNIKTLVNKTRKTKLKVTDPKNLPYHKTLCEFIVGSNVALNLVSDPFFIHLLHKFAPTYTMPSRHYLTSNILPNLLKDVNIQIQQLVQECLFCSLTTDIWTAPHALDSFISLTIHLISKVYQRHTAVLRCKFIEKNHTGENITSLLNEMIVSECVPRERLHCIVSDNNTAMLNGVTGTGISSIGCFLHTLHLIITHSMLAQIGNTNLIKKLKEIVQLYRKSSKEKQLFESIELNEEKDTSRFRLQQVIIFFKSQM